MIEVENLSKRYGNKLAVDGLSFVVQPGIVTGFLGPNGSGKSTTMRMIAGLDKPTAGPVTLNGGHYRTAAAPMAELGVLLEAKAVHTGRSARNHLLALAQTNGITARRVDEVIDIVGLRDVAGKRVGGFSLGMGQRLGVASALLGNPQPWSWTNPSTALTPKGFGGSAPCSRIWPRTGTPYSSPPGTRTYAQVTMPVGLLIDNGVLYSSAWSVAKMFFKIQDAGQVVRVNDPAFTSAEH